MTYVADYIDEIQADWAEIQPDFTIPSAGIIGRIIRLAQVIQIRSDQVLESCGITRSGFEILSLLTRTARPMTPGEISAKLLSSGAGTTKRLKKLASAGMIIRTANPADGRGALISLTDHAQERIIPILRIMVEFENSLIDALPAEEQEALTNTLRTLLGSIDTA